MASIFIYNYNNYYNRRVRGQNNTLSDYGTPIYIETGNAVNFNPADGVNTIFVAGKMSNSYTGKGDYFIYSEDNVSITSRWFILEADRTRNGQYRLQLRRDVIVDNYNAVLNGTALIEKGTVDDSNALIYNSEPIPVNQIKTKEYELRDDTNFAWIVGYIARNTSYDNGGSTDKNKMTFETSVIIPDLTVKSLSDWAYNKYVDKELCKNITPHLDFITHMDVDEAWTAYRDLKVASYDTNGMIIPNPPAYTVSDLKEFLDYLNGKSTEILDNMNKYSGLYLTKTVNEADYNSVTKLNGKILKSGDAYYKIRVQTKFTESYVNITENKSGDYMRTYLNGIFNNAPGLALFERNGSKVPCRYTYEYDAAYLTLEPMTYGSYSCEFPDENNRYHLKDAPYDMFAMPYSDKGSIQKPNGTTNVPNNKTLAISLAQEISRKLDANLYDMQLLPYCPFGGYNMVGNVMSLTDTNVKRYTAIKDANDNVTAYMIWCTASSGTKTIFIKQSPYQIYYTNKKIENQCNMYRLVSPNFNGQFEFNLAKNNTKSLDTFNVDFTYMPYNPYIHITPVPISGLYGSDFNDARGLICGGDFSLARVTDAWQSYQLQNKNYQAIFDRQIQNMDVNRKYQRIEESVGAVAGSFQTSAQGFMVGGGVGAAVGGVLGLSAGLGDLALSEGKYKEQRSYAQDIHQYQLENVRALPYSLSKTTAFTFNNKIFPILEYYTCTDEEKLAVANEIANTGMTVGVIGQVQEYAFNTWSYKNIVSRNFVKCRLIRLEDIKDDTHLIDAISNELNKGVYFS